MAERPILFSAPMVRAILDCRKTMTRRVVKANYQSIEETEDGKLWPWREDLNRAQDYWYPSPYGQRGDRLRVKEAAWMWCERQPNGTTSTGRPKWLYVPMREAPIHYAADHPGRPGSSIVSPDTGNQWGWRLKIGRFLHAWASRITLEVTDVRVERLQDITYEDALAEGVMDGAAFCEAFEPRKLNIAGETHEEISRRLEWPQRSFRVLWEKLNGAGSWDQNPSCWAVSFKRIEVAHD